MKIFSRILLLASFIFAGVLLAHAQEPSQSAAPQKQQEKPAPAKAAPAKPAAKVWTDDDLTSLRSPADDYQIEQQQEKQAQQAAAQQGASKQPAAAVDPSMPKTVQQADSMIADKSRYLTSEQDYLQRLQQKLKDTSVTGIEKERLEWRLKSHTVTTQTLQSQIKQLEADKAALTKKTASGNSNSAPPQSQ